MRDIAFSVLFIVVIVVVVTLLVLLAGALLLGLAWGLSLVFPVSIMDAAVVLMFVVGAIVLYVALSSAAGTLAGAWRGDALINEDWEDEEDWEEDPAPVWRKPPVRLPTMPTRTSQIKRVGRNAPCPCGSGRKYKNCCGR